MIEPRELPYPPTPREPPAGFERRADAPPITRFVGLIAHLFGVSLFALAPFAAAAAAVLLIADEETHLILRTAGFAVCTALVFVHLKSFLPHRRQLPAAVIPVFAEDQPTAYAFIERVANDLKVMPPRRVFVGSGTELQLGGKRSFLDLVRRPRWELHIGLWLWHAVTLSELQALVARTLAPMAGGRTERFRSTARALLDVLSNGVDRVDEVARESDATLAGLARVLAATYRLIAFPLRALSRLLLRIDPVRNDSLADDLDAVRLAGSDALVHAILRSDFAAAGLRTLDDALAEAGSAGIWTADLYAHVADGERVVRELHNDFTLGETPWLRGPTAGKYADVFEVSAKYMSTMWTGFPRPDEREQNAKRDFVVAERDDRSATVLLEDFSRLRERLTRLHYIEVLATDDDYFPLSPETVRRWIGTKPDALFPEKFAGCYDVWRKLDPGSPHDLAQALAAEAWDDVRLVSTAAGLYARAGERAGTWRAARMALDKLLQRTVYRPVGRTRAIAEDLEDDLRKAGRWLAALDRWAYVIHVHMAARLPQLHLHEELLARYECVLRFQPLAVDARGYRNRIAAFVRRLDDLHGHPSYRLRVDAAHEFSASRRDLAALLAEAAVILDPPMREWTGDVPLDEFLYAHAGRPPSRARGSVRYGRRLLAAWDEITGKARWLTQLSIAALLELHEQIEREFVDQVPVAAPSALEAPFESVPDLPLDGMEDVVELELAPEPPDAEIVEEVTEELVPEPESNPWGEGR